MNKACTMSIVAIGTLILLVPSLAVERNVPTTQAIETMRGLLGRVPVDAAEVLPGLSKACPLDLRRTSIAKAILEAVKSNSAEIPVTTYTQYREFRKSGDRQPYQKPYFEKRALLAKAVLAAWLQGDLASADSVNDLVWNICEETNWVIPAHESVGEIDLCAAETAATLAFTELLIGPNLPEEIRTRLREEVQRRVIKPYLDHGSKFWWNNGANNWTGVCAGSIGQVLLILEPDPERQARGLALVVDQLNRFIDRAFEEDGACTEGIGYWNYGLSHFVIFAEMFKARTGGAVDLLVGDKIRKVAGYPGSMAIGQHAFASFSDSHEEGAVLPFLAARLGDRCGRSDLFAQASDKPEEGRLGWVLCNLLWYGDRPRPEPIIEDAILPRAGVARRVGKTGDQAVILVAKAGNNAEQHNHNDVGSFVLRIGETTFLCDPGAGLYNAAYFGPQRYENVFASSYGHSVPRIGGMQQKPGAQYRGALEVTPDGTVRIDMHEAYGIAQLRRFQRTFRLDHDGRVTMTDELRFDGDGMEVEEAFVTWHDVKVNGPVAYVLGDQGMLEVHAHSAVFKAERLEDACKANKKKGILTRLSASCPQAPIVKAQFTFVYKKAG
ncbi:MAG: heparinase II/III domain-containing protein [Phycisphaerae bacterium]